MNDATTHRLDPPVDSKRDHLLGPERAALTLVEYGSYACPYCRVANAEVAKLRDRFGVLPDEVRYLFKIAAIKGYCRRANVEKVDAGPKGVVITFRDNKFAQPDRLVYFIRQHGQAAKVRPDMKVVFFQEWETPEERLMGTTEVLRQLANLAEDRKAA